MTTTQNIEFPGSLRDIAKPVHQNVWALPATVNFFLGGTAAGYYILWAISSATGNWQAFGKAFGGFLAAALVAAGFASLALEAGRPLRARYLMAHLKRSWMSRETATGSLFVVAAIFDGVTALFIARCLALAAACAFLLSQSMILSRCKAIPIWHDPIVPLLLISGGLTSGYALLLFDRCGLFLLQCDIAPYVNAIAFGCLGLNFAAWAVLLLRRRHGDIQPVIGCLRKPAKILVVVGIGQLLPVVLLLLARPWALNGSARTATGLLFATAVALLVGIWAQKRWLMHCGQYLCGMRLDG